MGAFLRSDIAFPSYLLHEIKWRLIFSRYDYMYVYVVIDIVTFKCRSGHIRIENITKLGNIIYLLGQ